MPRFNPLNSRPAYTVFRHIASNKEGSYGSEIADKEEISQGQASDNIRELREKDIIKRGKRKRAQYYEPRWDSLLDYMKNTWSTIGINIPITEDVLKDYVRFYSTEKRDSTIQRMLVDDFQLALEIYDELYELPESWSDTLEEMVDSRGSMSPHRFLEHAFKGEHSG